MSKSPETELVEQAVEHLRTVGLKASGRAGRVAAEWHEDDGSVAHTHVEWMQEQGFRVKGIDFDNRKVHFEVEDK